ncbi:hypothetical protein QBC46DRAFT_367938 [Diplogelasinospora grovesii]|uniref:Uncharacterized protein n=1 Tax=Diplogelasinospora grovesii TaxID=303347 RepID=A0AAN6MZ35_9PEZI|nr:hypothetical protein QBC46DRAFT_367938 [Diplogelasinospora grovesii]
MAQVVHSEISMLYQTASPFNPEELLKKCHAPTFKGYLHWRCKHSRIKKEASIVTYWKVFSMFYSDKCGRWVDSAVLFDIGNVLDQAVLAHERLRVQIAVALIIAGATATRPGALIENLCYKDVEFHMFPPAPGGKRARIGIVDSPNKFGFHKEDTLLRDPILYLQSLAFADGAFLDDFKGPENIYNLIVPPGQPRMVLKWKEEWRDKPIFRDIQGRGANMDIASDRTFTYSRARIILIKLGRALGYEKVLEWYDLHRRSGKKLNNIGDSSTYVKFYMDDFNEVGLQEIVFGSEPQRDIIHLMGRLIRRSNAPTRLTDTQMTAVNKNKKLLELRRKKTSVAQKMKRMGWTPKSAPKEGRGAELLERHNRFARQIDTLRKTLYDKYSKEISRQLNGNKPSEHLAPPTIHYQLRAQERIAKLFSEAANITGYDELFAYRMQIVHKMTQLCKQREPRRSGKRLVRCQYRPKDCQAILGTFELSSATSGESIRRGGKSIKETVLKG